MMLLQDEKQSQLFVLPLIMLFVTSLTRKINKRFLAAGVRQCLSVRVSVKRNTQVNSALLSVSIVEVHSSKVRQITRFITT